MYKTHLLRKSSCRVLSCRAIRAAARKRDSPQGRGPEWGGGRPRWAAGAQDTHSQESALRQTTLLSLVYWAAVVAQTGRQAPGQTHSLRLVLLSPETRHRILAAPHTAHTSKGTSAYHHSRFFQLSFLPLRSVHF